MDPIIFGLVVIQCGVVAFLWFALKKRALGKLGFLFMATTLVYHGFTEVAQAIFPGHDIYRPDVDPDALRVWMLLITAAMVLFAGVYIKVLRAKEYGNRQREILNELRGVVLLKWPVLLSLGVVGLAIVITEKGTGSGYFAAGLADQFTVLIIGIALTTIVISSKQRWHTMAFAVFAVLVTASGQRSQVMITTLIALSAMTRYGIKVAKRTLVSVALIIAGLFIAISIGRGDYGRFKDEGITERLRIIGDSFLNSSGDTDRISAILDDTVYRFDGNSFGALVVQKQLDGAGSTGLTQLYTTVRYAIPSFIYTGKGQLDVYLRNEEGYQDQFYGFDDGIDFICDFWNLLVGYTGIIGFVLAAPLLGWILAALDNWLAVSVSLPAYLTGVCLSILPLNPELGVVGIPYTLRGLAVLIAVTQFARLRRFSLGRPKPRRQTVPAYSLPLRRARLSTASSEGD